MPTHEPQTDERTYQVVVNNEGQYSLLLAGKDIPRGWRYADKSGSKAECLQYVKDVWTDMTPLSLINAANEIKKPSAPGAPTNGAAQFQTQNLVQRLSEGEHPVEITRRASETIEALREAIGDGYLHIKFTDTKGGTEIGIRLDSQESEIGSAELNSGAGNIRLVGSTTLDSQRVLCVANVDLSTLTGNGHLVQLSSHEALAS